MGVADSDTFEVSKSATPIAGATSRSISGKRRFACGGDRGEQDNCDGETEMDGEVERHRYSWLRVIDAQANGVIFRDRDDIDE